MPTRFNFKLKAKCVKFTVAHAQFIAEKMELNASMKTKIASLSLSSLRVIDLENKSECAVSGDGQKCFEASVDYTNKLAFALRFYSPTIVLIPKFINHTLEAITPAINGFLKLNSTDEQNKQKQKLNDLKTPKKRDTITKLPSVPTKGTREKQTKKIDTIAKCEKSLNKHEEVETIIKESKNSTNIEVNLICTNFNIFFKNYDGNELIVYSSFESNLSIKDGEMESFNFFTNDCGLIGTTPQRKESVDIAKIKEVTLAITTIGQPDVRVNISQIFVRFSNRDLDNTLKLLKDFDQSLRSLTLLSNDSAVTQKKEIDTTQGLVLEETYVNTKVVTQDEFKMPKLNFSLSVGKVNIDLISEFVSEQGKTIDSFPALVFTTKNTVIFLKNQRLDLKITETGIEYTKVTKSGYTKEPLVELFDISSECEIPHFNIFISPADFLLVDITPEFVGSMNSLFENWAKAINAEFYKSRGLCKVTNLTGVQMDFYTKGMKFAIQNDATVEVPIITDNEAVVKIEDNDDIYITSGFNRRKSVEALSE
ncbi:hypothetical protein EIN_408800, partial [Entamoeba invadens IP1]